MFIFYNEIRIEKNRFIVSLDINAIESNKLFDIIMKIFFN